jgi:hypothetical protein
MSMVTWLIAGVVVVVLYVWYAAVEEADWRY